MTNLTAEIAAHLDLVLQNIKNDKVSSVTDIKENLIPDKSDEYCTGLFYILKDYHPRLLFPDHKIDRYMFWATDYVPPFLHNGGFTKIFADAAEIHYAEKEKEELNLELLRYNVKNGKRIYKTYWWTFFFALTAFLLAIFNTIWNLFITH